MSMAERNPDAPYFAFEGEVTPIPDEPVLCRGCGGKLEPLRRWGGYCGTCIAGWQKLAPGKVAVQAIFRKVRSFKGPNGEQRVELRCTCGQKRTVKLWTWQNRRPQCCNKCRMQAINDRGFEAEHGR